MSAKDGTSTSKNSRILVEVNNRINIDVTRFRGETWYHIYQKSNRSKCISVQKADLVDLTSKIGELKRSSFKLYKNEYQERAASNRVEESANAQDSRKHNHGKRDPQEPTTGKKKRSATEDEFFHGSKRSKSRNVAESPRSDISDQEMDVSSEWY